MKAPDAGAGGGADGGGATTGPAAFIGTWQYQRSSTISFTCDDGSTFQISNNGTETETFTAGTQANEIIASSDNGCPITCAVSGQTATCASSEACDGVTLTSDVYTLVGNQLHEVFGGSAQLDDGTTCQFTAPASVLDRI
jgi:hypothetical protein